MGRLVTNVGRDGGRRNNVEGKRVNRMFGFLVKTENKMDHRLNGSQRKMGGSVKDRLGGSVVEDDVTIVEEDEDTFVDTKKDWISRMKKPRMGMVADMIDHQNTSAKRRLGDGQAQTEIKRKIPNSRKELIDKPSILSRLGAGTNAGTVTRTISIPERRTISKAEITKSRKPNFRSKQKMNDFELKPSIMSRLGSGTIVKTERADLFTRSISSNLSKTVENDNFNITSNIGDLRMTMRRNVPDDDLRKTLKGSDSNEDLRQIIRRINPDDISVKRTSSNPVHTEIVEEDSDSDDIIDNDFGNDRKVASREDKTLVITTKQRSVSGDSLERDDGFFTKDHDDTKILVRINQEMSDSEPEEEEHQLHIAVSSLARSIKEEELLKLKEKELQLKELLLEEKKSKEIEKLHLRDNLLERERQRLRKREILLEKENLKEKERLLEKEKLREEKHRQRDIESCKESERLKLEEEKLKQERKDTLRGERLREIERIKEKEEELKKLEVREKKQDKEEREKIREKKELVKIKALEEKEASLLRVKQRVKEEEETLLHEKRKLKENEDRRSSRSRVDRRSGDRSKYRRSNDRDNSRRKVHSSRRYSSDDSETEDSDSDSSSESDTDSSDSDSSSDEETKRERRRRQEKMKGKKPSRGDSRSNQTRDGSKSKQTRYDSKLKSSPKTEKKIKSTDIKENNYVGTSNVEVKGTDEDQKKAAELRQKMKNYLKKAQEAKEKK